jgi:hypothetical protein
MYFLSKQPNPGSPAVLLFTNALIFAGRPPWLAADGPTILSVCHVAQVIPPIIIPFTVDVIDLALRLTPLHKKEGESIGAIANALIAYDPIAIPPDASRDAPAPTPAGRNQPSENARGGGITQSFAKGR